MTKPNQLLHRSLPAAQFEKSTETVSANASNDPIIKAQTDGGKAFGDFYARTAPRIAHNIGSYFGIPGVAPDITQEAFLTAWEKRAGYTEGTPEGWVHTIARNKGRDHMRRARRVSINPSGDIALLADQSGAVVPDISDEIVGSPFFVEALRKINPVFGAVLLAEFGHGYTALETASILNIKEATVRTRRHRGLKAIRKLLESGQLSLDSD